MDDDWLVEDGVGAEDTVTIEVRVINWPFDVTTLLLVVEELVWEVEVVVVGVVPEMVLLVEVLVVRGGREEVLLDNVEDEVVFELVGVDEVVGTGVGDVEVVLAGKGEDGVSELTTGEVVEGTGGDVDGLGVDMVVPKA